jgi:hypothetical protein
LLEVFMALSSLREEAPNPRPKPALAGSRNHFDQLGALGNQGVERSLNLFRISVERPFPAAHKAGRARLGINRFAERATLKTIQKQSRTGMH